jgi:hypothetical protein
MWHLFQGLIIVAVVATNIHWHWTPNGYLAPGIAGATAFELTALLSAGATAQETMTSKERSAPERRLIQEVKDSRPVKIRIPGKPALSPKECEDSGGRLVVDMTCDFEIGCAASNGSRNCITEITQTGR